VAGTLSGTKAELLRRQLQQKGIAGQARRRIVRRPDGAPPPLSFAQERLWFLDRLVPGTGIYNISTAVRLPEAVAVGALAAALSRLVERHEILRTVYRQAEDRPVQTVYSAAPQPLPLVDLRGLARSRRDAVAMGLAAQEGARPFDLHRGPIIRGVLVRLARDEHLLLLAVHHIAADGESMKVLSRDLHAFYRAQLAGRAPDLPELPVQYADFAAWQRDALSGARLEQELAWWRDRLADAPAVLDLPADRPRPPVQAFRGRRERLRVADGTAARLGELARAEGATAFMVWLALWGVLLSRLTGCPRPVVGTPVAGRNRVELEPLVGLFVNTLALPVAVDERTSFRRLLAGVRSDVLAARRHDELPFERLVEELAPERSLSHNPLVQVVLNLMERGERNEPSGRGAASVPSTEVIGLDPGTAKFDLTLGIVASRSTVRGALSFNPDLFDGTTGIRICRAFETLADAAAAEPDRPLESLASLPRALRFQVLHAWNDTGRGGTAPDVPSLVEQRARSAPDAIAVSAAGSHLSYGALWQRAAAVAGGLADRRIGREDRVGICLERSPELVVALAGVLLCRAGYVPVDPAYPRERVVTVLQDAGCRLLIAGAAAPELPVPTTTVAELGAAGGSAAPLAPVPAQLPEALAYVVYTSGSTGTPKGVQVSHRGLANLVSWHRRSYPSGGGARSTMVANPAFDASVWEIWPVLAGGGTLVVVPAHEVTDPEVLLERLTAERVTVSFLPTPVAEAVLRRPELSASPLEVLLTGGDRLRAVPPAGARVRLVNHYGPTEASVVATCGGVAPAADGPPPIGRPIDGVRVYVVDSMLRPIAPGVAGELVLGGSGLARGYRGRRAETAERFVPDPFGAPGDRLYRTGDSVRFLADGRLDFLGRTDLQVQVRGFRIELGEIEALLARAPGVREGLVTAPEGTAGHRLVAYTVGTEGRDPDPAAVRSFLERHLPRYMVPEVYVPLDALPLTPRGKIDRRALPSPEVSRGPAPSGVVEEVVASIWGAVLGVDRITRDQDFFALGGHSLLATQMMARLRAVLDVDLPLAALFERPTLAGFSAAVRAVRDGVERGNSQAEPPIRRVPRTEDLPLSFGQERLWFLARLDPESVAYNIFQALRLRGPLDLPALDAAVRGVVCRHEILRTRFPERDGRPVQVVTEGAPPWLTVVDLSGLPAERCRAEHRRLVVTERVTPFDLSRDRMLRARSIRSSRCEHTLLLTVHHIAADGWSMTILARELGELYRARRARRRPMLRDLPFQYADFASWQRAHLAGETVRQEVDWWRRLLDGVPRVLDLPTDRPRRQVEDRRAAAVRRSIGEREAAALRALAREQNATLYMVLLAAVQVLLARSAGQDAPVVGTALAGRDRLETEGLIGLFVNTLPIPADLSGDPSFVTAVARVRATMLAAHAHRDLPFDKLVEELQPERSLVHTPIFQVMFLLQNLPREDTEPGGLSFERLEGAEGSAAFDLTIAVTERGGRLDVVFELARHLFDVTTVERMARHFERLLDSAVADPYRPVRALEEMSPAERQQVVHEWGRGRPSPWSGRSIPARFAERVAGQPDAIALIREVEGVTFGALGERVDRLTAVLRRRGVEVGSAVGVAVGRRPEVIVAMLAVLRAGGVYVPLDPSYPVERLEQMVADAAIGAVLTERRPAGIRWDRLAGRRRLEVISVDEVDEVDGARGAVALLPPPALEQTACILYTSGSTGRPKGVVISHGSLADYIETAIDLFGVQHDDRLLQFASLSFDISVEEILVSLLAGASIMLREEISATSPSHLLERAERMRVTVLDLPTAYWHLLSGAVAESGLRWPPCLRFVAIGGEKASAQRLRGWGGQLPAGGRFLNAYGPTEAPVVATSWEWCAGDARWPGDRDLPIGRPIPGTNTYLVDAELEPVAAGQSGELVLGGPRVQALYNNRPAATARSFVPDPFSDRPGGRLYRTGDLGRFLADGSLEFFGRIDRQVKVRGFRVEPEEIERVLADHPNVRECVCAVHEVTAGDGRLVGYVVPVDDQASSSVYQDFLQSRLPEYMVPTAFVELARLPLTPNGKVDRRALPTPRLRTGVPPDGPLEEALAGIWADILGVEGIGRDDDFFRLGGHSLLAVRLMARIRDRLGIDLPVAELFESRSLAALARRVEKGSGGARDATAARRPLVAIRQGGSRPPLFLVHPVGGDVLCYEALAQALGGDLPVFGLQSVDPVDGAGEDSVETMAERYITAVRTVQPEPPYRLAGWSMGGAVAYEMARRLEASGVPVDLLVVIDGPPGEGADPVDLADEVLVARFARDVARTAGIDADEVAVQAATAVEAAEQGELIERLALGLRRAGAREVGVAELRAHLARWMVNFRAATRYRAGPYGGRMVLFRATAHSGGAVSDLGWGQRVGDLTLQGLDGDHYSILRRPGVHLLADRLRELLAPPDAPGARRKR